MALQDTALKLIRKFGEDRTIVFQIPGATPADPLKPWDVDPTAVASTVSVPAVVVPISRKLVDGKSIQEGDETVYIAALSMLGIVPETNSKILDEGQEKNILALRRVKPGLTDFLYILQVRAN